MNNSEKCPIPKSFLPSDGEGVLVPPPGEGPAICIVYFRTGTSGKDPNAPCTTRKLYSEATGQPPQATIEPTTGICDRSLCSIIAGVQNAKSS